MVGGAPDPFSAGAGLVATRLRAWRLGLALGVGGAPDPFSGPSPRAWGGRGATRAAAWVSTRPRRAPPSRGKGQDGKL